MKNSTALVYADGNTLTNRLVANLTATGLFNQIRPLNSVTALFRHLRTQAADMVCWPVAQPLQDAAWIGQLQANDDWQDLPLIAFAADQQSLIDSFTVGASDAVPLEIDPSELSARIQRHLQRWQRLLELRRAQEHLQQMALSDPLTKLGNRATFDMSMQQAAARSQRSGMPYSLLMIDLDHFKAFNDSHGHQVGDMILQRVAGAIKTAARNADICCRYGGEEFAVILPDTKAQNAAHLAKRIHQQIAKVSRAQPQERRPLTVSIGISSVSRGNQADPQQLIEEADQALYLAKEKGRNRTENWQAETIIPLRGFSCPQTPQLAGFSA